MCQICSSTTRNTVIILWIPKNLQPSLLLRRTQIKQLQTWRCLSHSHGGKFCFHVSHLLWSPQPALALLSRALQRLSGFMQRAGTSQTPWPPHRVPLLCHYIQVDPCYPHPRAARYATACVLSRAWTPQPHAGDQMVAVPRISHPPPLPRVSILTEDYLWGKNLYGPVTPPSTSRLVS